MNLDPLSFTLSQISYLIASLTKKNYKQVVGDLSKLAELHGIEADRHLLRCLFAAVDFSDKAPASGHSAKVQPVQSAQSLALQYYCGSVLLQRPAAFSNIVYAFDPNKQKTLKVGPQFFSQLVKVLRLSPVQEVVLALALSHSTNSELVSLSKAHLRTAVPALVKSYVDTEGSGQQQEGGLHDTSPELLHLILTSITPPQSTPPTPTPTKPKPKPTAAISPPSPTPATPPSYITATQHAQFLRSLRRDFPLERVPVVLAPLVYPDCGELESIMAASGGGSSGGAGTGDGGAQQDSGGATGGVPLADMVAEIGFAFTASFDDCRSHLLKLIPTPPAPISSSHRIITPLTVARLIQTLIKTSSESSSGKSSWNLEVLVQSLKEVAANPPGLQWTAVVSELDNAEVLIRDRVSLVMLVQILKLGLQVPEMFPVDQLFRRWSHSDAQLHLIQTVLRNSDVFSFADYQCPIVSVDMLKTPPPPDQDSKDLANWRCLPLVDLLLHLSQVENGRFYGTIQDLFKFPVQNCPDVLVLALLQCSATSQNTASVPMLKQELLTSLVPIFLGNHPNSGIILHTAWHTQSLNIKPIIMHSMAEWYLRGGGGSGSGGDCDQARLSRILDVAQDLKALSLLLNVQSYPFIIDLACLASRREYLKLEKWLNDKIREHGEAFASACVKFVHRRCPQGIDSTPASSSSSSSSSAKSHSLPTDLVATIVLTLQHWSNTSSTTSANQELQQAIHVLAASCNQSLLKTRAAQQQQVAQAQAQAQAQAVAQAQAAAAAVAAAQAQQQAQQQMAVGGIASALAARGGGGVGGYSASTLAGQLYTPSNTNPNSSLSLDNTSLPSLSSSSLAATLNSLQLSNNPSSSTSSSTPSFPAGLGQGALGGLVPSPGSPSRLLAAAAAAAAAAGNNSGPSAYQVGGMGGIGVLGAHIQGPIGGAAVQQQVQQVQQVVVGAGQAGATTLGGMSRLGPTATMDKQRGGAPESTLFPEIAPNVSKDIEDEANSYFQRIYNHPPHPTLTIDEVLEMLKRFQESPIKREREVFNCMLRNLFEEYRFFPQYPDKELHITAQLFGGIIERGLVTTYMALGLALRFVLDALRKPEGSKMYYFGIAALDRFKSRLKDYHKYCEHVRAIGHFKDFPPHLIEYVEYGLQSAEPPTKPTGQVLPASINALLGSNYKPPPGSNPPSNQPTTTASTSNSTPNKPSTTSAASTATQQQQGAASQAAGGSGSSQAATLGSRPSIANATNIDTLLVATEQEEKITAPPEGLQDKTAFIFNNLSQLNLQSKCDELKEIVSEEYWPWISQYLVMKRASIEFNFHLLYSNFLDTLKMPEVNRMVTKETFRNIKVLLRSDKGIANFSDRSLLKNLGHWLGIMTLARNKPILQIDIDLKSLLVEAYHKGQQELLYVVPFVAKIVESCSKSKVFKPPNPWTVGIMNVLGELHQEPELKLNLKFEIEVLCKNLDLEVSALKPVVYLKDPERLHKLEYQLSQPGGGSQQQAAQQGGNQQSGGGNKVVSGGKTVGGAGTAGGSAGESPAGAGGATGGEPELVAVGGQQSGQQGDTPDNMQNNSATPTGVVAAPEPRFGYMDIQLANNAAFHSHITISPSLLLFQTQPSLKPLVRQSVERAVLEWISPVVERSSKIAMQTCEHIIRKDFALDPDENRMRQAAHFMVRNLSAGMAMITCRDQILTSINAQMKSALQNHLGVGVGGVGTSPPQQKEMIEQAAGVLAQDNMELACAIIQKSAIEKAIPDIDKRLQSEYDMRRIARLEGRRYCDPIALTYQAERMPDKIRLKVGGVTSSQMAVYEEFGRNIPGFQPLLLHEDGVSQQFASPTPLAQMEPGAFPSGNAQSSTTSSTPSTTLPLAPPVIPTPSTTSLSTNQQQSQPTLSTDELINIYEKLALEAEMFVQSAVAAAAANVGQQVGVVGQQSSGALVGAVQVVKECLLTAVHHHRGAAGQMMGVSEVTACAMEIILKCVEALQEQPLLGEAETVTIRFKEIIVRILKSLGDPRAFGPQWTNKQVTRFLTDFRDELRYNEIAVETLIRAGLVNLNQFDLALAQAMDNGNYRALNFATALVHNLMLDERSAAHIVTDGDLNNTVDMLMKINSHHHANAAVAAAAVQLRGPGGMLHPPQTQTPESLSTVVDMLRLHHEQQGFFGERMGQVNPNASASSTLHIQNGILQVRAPHFEDPPGLVEKTDYLIREWIAIYNMHPTGRDSTKAFSLFVHQMNVHGILKTDDLITRFFRLSTQLCVEAVYCLLNQNEGGSGGGQGQQGVAGTLPVVKVKAFSTLDAFVRLVSLLVKHSGETSNTTTKIHLLNKILGIVAGCVLQDHENRGIEFRQFPYHRIFIMLFMELNANEAVLEAINFHVLTAYCHTLHILRPTKAAGFCYAWLELVSHRLFLGRMLAQTPQQKGWAMYAQLLIDLFKYLAPFLRNAELAKPVTMLYKGTLRVLLVLLHDFPEFLCDYHYGFCDVIPPNCIQMRNLILSAFPRNMRLPDPFTPNLKVDVLQEITFGPRVLTNYEGMIQPQHFKKDLDSYLKARAPVTFLSDLRSNLQVSNEPGMRYNIPLMNALVLYVGSLAITYIRGKNQAPNMSTIAHSAHMDIFQNLAVDLDTEGRYLFLNSIANQLRYPNSHTHYFSCTLLYLFAEANTEAIQEQITRVLLERLIVNRPHPWGLLITFIELIKNPVYKFWTHEFVHCASEIEKLFESVARSCFVQKNAIVQQVDGQEQE